jgi:hypothetical protein
MDGGRTPDAAPRKALYDRPEPTLRQLLQRAHERHGEGLLYRNLSVWSEAFAEEPAQSAMHRSEQPPPGRLLDVAAPRTEATGEDMEELAEKIGRILAQEARRHGIDV